MSISSRREPSLQLDTAAPTPSATISNTFATTTTLSNTCTISSECAGNGVCSNGICNGVNQAAPFASTGSLGAEPTTHLDKSTAIGIGVGVAAFVILMVGFGLWFFKRRARQQPITSPESPPATRDRSASTATKWTIDNDQRTLVASMPNSPQHAMFAAEQPSGLPSEFYTMPGKIIDDEEKTEGEKQFAEYRRWDEVTPSSETPASPVDKGLPTPPTEEKRYAINVNINKSMIFDDVMFNAAAYAASPVSTPHERAPRYRFEEYIPPVLPINPRISITRSKDRVPSTISSEYELENYPHGSGYIESDRNSRSDIGSEYGEPQGPDPRCNALSKLEGGLSLPELPPPSPSLSFRSYDWYQDIIGGDQSVGEPPIPEFPSRNSARAVNPLFSHPPGTDSSLMPGPLSPAFPSPVAGSHLHPSSARLSYLPSPTSPNFRLSPTVYQMPNSHASKSVPDLQSTRPVSEVSTIPRYSHRYSRYASWMPEDDLELSRDDLTHPQFPRYNSMVASMVQGSEVSQTARTSARNSARNSARQSRSQGAQRPQSTTTQKSHYSRSWLPDDGLYLPEEGTEDSFKVFKRERLASRPTSYSPLA